MQSIFFSLVASCFSSFFTKVLKDMGYDSINSSSPSFNSTIYTLYHLSIIFLIASNCLSPCSLIAFNCSSFLPSIFSGLLKSPSFLSSSVSPLLKALPNGEYQIYLVQLCLVCILNLHQSKIYIFPIH